MALSALVVVVCVAAVLDLGAAAGNPQEYEAECKSALGMQSGAIHDDAISASSSYDSASVGPQNGRIRTEQNGGAWCPKNQITSKKHEYMQIDLGKVKKLTRVETQGRFGNGQGQEYAEKYKLEYQRNDSDNQWIVYKDRKGEEVFEGNDNTYLAEERVINPPLVARRVRIVPYSEHPRTVCMRVELHGCDWRAGIMSYSMPQGQKRGAEVDLHDFSYDGQDEDDYLSGGLGQLIDGEEGESNFRLDPTGLGRKGYEWIGWKNESMNTPPIEIIFQFDKVRNFSAIRIHCNNLFSKEVRVFRRSKVYFSIGGEVYSENPKVYDFMRDELIEFARQVIIPLNNRIGRFVKLQLFFDARWMMISEVRFDSTLATGNFTDESLQPGQKTKTGGSHRISPGPGSTPPTASDDSHLNTKAPLDDQFIGIIVGALAALLLLLVAIAVYVFWRHRQHKYREALNEKQAEHHVTLNLQDLRAMANGKVSNGNMYNSIATSEDVDAAGTLRATQQSSPAETYDGIQGRKLPDLPALKTPDSAAELSYNTDTATSREYAVPDVTKSALLLNGGFGGLDPAAGAYNNAGGGGGTLPLHPRAMFAAGEGVHLQGFSGNSLYAVPNNLDLLWKDELSVMEFPRESLMFKEKLGEGQFGEVNLCEAECMTDVLGDDFLINRTGSRSILVAVKILRQDADDHARADFHKEVKIMSKLKDANIVRVLGVCTREEPLCMIVEYMRFGDLNQFLQQHVAAEGTAARNPHRQCLSYGCLIYMATQIASGMKYLETLNMVHRDLATRNCLVGNNYTIKISDFGMSRSLYSTDYYRIEGKAMLPIRWMAWESVLLGKFSTKSDVWSFAVTLWETLLFAREQPFESLSDEQVIDNCGHYYRGDRAQIMLPQPPNCPKEIYDLMVECWNHDEAYRPAFREIHMFLQRKNMGYNPRDERSMQQAALAQQQRGHINVPVV